MSTLFTTSSAIDVISNFLKQHHLSDEGIGEVLAHIESVEVKRGKAFSKRGSVCKQVGILIGGLLYASYQPLNGKDEKVSRFFYQPKNMVVTSFESYQREVPANESIIAIEDSYLMCIEKRYLEQLYQRNPQVNYLGRKMAEDSYIKALQRIHNLQALSNFERVKEFKGHHLDLYNRVKSSQLASYLGMSRNRFTQEWNKC